MDALAYDVAVGRLWPPCLPMFLALRRSRASNPTASAAAWHAIGLLAVAAAAATASNALPLRAAFPVKAAVVFAVIAAVVMTTVASHHPHDRFGPANAVTMVRAAMTSLVVALLGERADAVTAAAAVASSLVVVGLDGFDGRVARRTGMASPFGARFDMEVDALLILALSALAWQHGKAGAWVTLSGLLRYAFVAAAWPWPWMRRPLPPSRRRQTVCVVQIVALMVILVPAVTPPASGVIATLALGLLSWSFLVDIAWLGRQP